jgi:hypothetical protein
VNERTPCCIPGCGRTFKRDADYHPDSLIMCGRHWRMGDVRMRDRHKQLRKRCRWFSRRWERRQNAIRRSPKHAKFGRAWQRACEAADTLWMRIKADVEIKAVLGAEDAPRRRPRVSA